MAAEHQTPGHRSADDLEVGVTGARFGGAAGRRSRAADQKLAEKDGGATHRRRSEQLAVGQVGARFSPVLRRWRQSKQENSESKGSGAHRNYDVPQAVPPRASTPVSEPSRAETAEWVDWAEEINRADWDGVGGPDGLVRPYAWTGGRTASHLELSLETLISVTGQPLDPTAPPEHRTIVALCAAPRSVAELAALLSIPLGVARVVLGDVAQAGSIVVHRGAGPADAAPGIDLMRRVLNGLQRL